MAKINASEIARKLNSLNDYFRNEFKEIDGGAYRTAYKYGPGKIIKVPNTDYSFNDQEENDVNTDPNDFVDCGIRANLIEHYIARKYTRCEIFCPCDLVWANKIPLIVMENLRMTWPSSKQAIFEQKLEDSSVELFDGERQVGMNSKKVVLCYDFGNEFDLIPAVDMRVLDRKTKAILKELSNIKITKIK